MTDKKQEETTRQRYLRQTHAQFSALGQFVQSFETMVDSARAGCEALLHGTEDQIPLIDVILHHHALGAVPLAEIYRYMLIEVLRNPKNKFEEKEAVFARTIMKQGFKRYQDMAKIRNDIIHATWFIGHSKEDQEDFSIIEGFKFKGSSSGMGPVKLPETVEEMSEHILECDRISSIFRKIAYCVAHEGTLTFSKSFEFQTNTNNNQQEVLVVVTPLGRNDLIAR
jgi:hypothetical protein